MQLPFRMTIRFLIVAVVTVGLAAGVTAIFSVRQPVVYVGVLHSLSGTMEISEKEVAMVTVAAFEEINKAGGILGHRIVPVVADGASDSCRFAGEARRLIKERRAQALFGCWTSASRKAVKPVVEQTQSLLFYPVQYEGFEASPNIVYLGQVPNQQIRPAVKYAIDHFGKRFYLVGSNYVFPRTANRYIKDIAGILQAGIVGETYIPLGGSDFTETVAQIRAVKPDVILNTLNGESNLYFFRALYKAGIHPSDIPVISFSIGENEVKKMGEKIPREALAGQYVASSYFDSLKTSKNDSFKAFLKVYQITSSPGDAMEAAYNGVYIYKQAVEECGSFDPRIVARCIPIQSFNGAGGILYVDPLNNHAWKKSRIGRIAPSLAFEIVFDSMRPLEPQPYPSYKTLKEWESIVRDFNCPLQCKEQQ